MTKPATITRRCFIAIGIPDDVQKQLKRAQIRLKQAQFKLSYVHPENMHLTLAFLGDVLTSRIQDAAGAVGTAVLGSGPFQLEAHQLGYFGKRGSPRAIWSQIDGDLDQLIDLQKRLTDALVQNGFPLEGRKFRPHLTLARIRRPKRNLPLVDHLENDKHQYFGEIPVNELLLIESILHPDGPEYHILHTADLLR